MVSQFMEQIENANVLIDGFFHQYYGDMLFFGVTVICFVYLFVTCEELRYKFLLPIAIIFLIIVNPVLYHYVLSKVIYWRLFWMIPNVVLMGATVIVLLKRRKRVWQKWSILVLATVFVFCCGNNVFQHDSFTRVQNWEKLAQETIDVCDVMLEWDKAPRAIITEELFCEVRQYAPEISMMYGRNAHGYIKYIGKIPGSVFCSLELQNSPDFDFILSNAKQLEYNFLVVTDAYNISNDILQIYGYKEVSRMSGYIIYYNEELDYVPEEKN